MQQLKPTLKADLAWKLITFLFLLALGWYLWGYKFMPLGRPSHSIEATQLRLELRTQQIAAHQKYDGKTIEVTGKVYQTSMSMGSPVVSVGVMFTNVDCFLSKSDASRAASLRAGDAIRVIGRARTRGSDATLSPCKIN